MTRINEMRKRLSAGILSRQAQASVEDTKSTVIEKQQEQLLHGLNAKGKPIGKYRSNKYARVKNEMNPLPGLGVPDLKVTGSFYKGMQVRVTAKSFSTDSTDEKTPELTDKYGPDIFGLTDKSKSEYIQELRPVFTKRIKEKLRV